jgi:hypothetical protein
VVFTDLLACLLSGNSYSDDERCIVAGYDNGDIKLFDLRANAIRYETNVANGELRVDESDHQLFGQRVGV